MSARRESVLREMGLTPLWRQRSRASACAQNELAECSVAREEDCAGSGMLVETTAFTPEPRVLEPALVAQATPSACPSIGTDARVARIAGAQWEELEREIRACTACRLCEQRRQAVPGVGDRQGPWMLVGEAPGSEEDRRGEPFVGQAGKLLDAMLAAIGLVRGEGVYIANTVKCRPPLNRTPAADEIAACLPFLERQIRLIQPRILIALGRPAAETLLGMEVRINAARGKEFSYDQIPVVVTYHPAYLLRNPADKCKAWEDLCRARRLMARRD